MAVAVGIVYCSCTMAQSAPPINSLTPASVSFDPSTLPGMPTVQFADGAVKASVGYQSGDWFHGKVLYYPWQVMESGGSLTGSIANGIPHGVILSFNAASGDFGNPANWSFFDISTLVTPPAGCGSVRNPCYAAKGYNSAVIVGDNVYLVPAGVNPFPVFVRYDASKSLTDPHSYQTFPAPPRGTTLGKAYGWCTAVSDGRYIYYVPNMDWLTKTAHGNIVRYDPATPFDGTDPNSKWTTFDMAAQVNANAVGYQSAVYDGHRYIYYVPFHGSLIVRFDTWDGGSSLSPAAFQHSGAYKTLDPTQLGQTGLPKYTGSGSPSQLAGFTGAVTVSDPAGNEYLYMIPWATYPNNSQNPTLMSTAARVRIGTLTNGTWNSVDFSDGSASPPNWEIFDLATLAKNSQWPANWPSVYASSNALSGQSQIAGYQIAWVDATFPAARIGFGADMAEYWVQHDVSHPLADPAGWYVSPIAKGLTNGNMGGAYDPQGKTFYPASPKAPLFQANFSGAPQVSGYPANQAVPVNQAATFTVKASGKPTLTYQWCKNGRPIPGATNATYVTPRATSVDNGAQYSVVISNSAGKITTPQVLLSVNASNTPSKPQ